MGINRDLAIILVRPQMGENIGAAARAMKNFAITDLRIVAPRDGWPNPKAISMSTYGEEIIHQAKIFDNIADAITDLNQIYATCASSRDLQIPYCYSSDIGKFINSSKPARVGIMFGPEATGLTNEDMSFANRIITIAANAEYTSLNLAQAVAIVCYEIYNSINKNELISAEKHILASSSDLESINKFIMDELLQKKYFEADDLQAAFKIKTRNFLKRIDALTKAELNFLWGVVKKLSSRERK